MGRLSLPRSSIGPSLRKSSRSSLWVGWYVASRACNLEAVRSGGGLLVAGGGDFERLGCGFVIFFPIDNPDIDR